MDQQEATRRFYSHVWPHRAMVFRAALYLTRNTAEAEDVAQETLMKAFRSLDSFQDGTDMRAWLMTILRHTRIDRLRSAASSADNISLEDLPTEPMDLSGEAGRGDDAWRNAEQVLESFSDQQIIDALLTLPEEVRWTLLLVDVEGWTTRRGGHDPGCAGGHGQVACAPGKSVVAGGIVAGGERDAVYSIGRPL